MPIVQILNGPNKDRHFPINGGEMVGRDPANAIQVFAPGVSRVHFQFVNDNGHFFVEDRNSSNGTYVNNGRITRHSLVEGDVVTVGGVNMRFHYGQPPPPSMDDGGMPGMSGLVPTVGAQRGIGGSTAAHPAVDPGQSVVFQDGAEEESLEDYALDASLIFTDSTRFDTSKPTTTGRSSAVATLEKRLNLYHRISQSLASISDLDRLLAEIMNNLFESFPQADRGFIMLGKSFDTLEPRMVKHRDPTAQDSDQVTISRTIARRAYEQKRSILSSNAMEDARFSGGMSILNFRILSMMCSPLIYRDEVKGIIHIDTQDRAKKFTPDDLNLLTGIAAQAATFLKNIELIDDIQKETEAVTNLQRYFNPELAKKIISKEIDLAPGGQQKEGTVFFSDIIGFTSMTEKMAPNEVVEWINRYFHVMVDIIFKHSGTIDKFGGDAIMAEWNVPVPVEDEALRACCAALEMQNQLAIFNYDLMGEDRPEIHMGIGLNTGKFIAGNIGSEKRMEYTCIGDNVNLAQRVESKAGRGQVYASDSTFEQAKHGLRAIKVGETKVKGRVQAVTIYSVRGTSTPDPALWDTSLPVEVDGKKGLIVKLKSAPEKDPGHFAALIVFFEEPLRTAPHATLKVQELDELELPLQIRNVTQIPGHPGYSVQALIDLTGTKLATMMAEGLVEADVPLEQLARK